MNNQLDFYMEDNYFFVYILKLILYFCKVSKPSEFINFNPSSTRVLAKRGVSGGGVKLTPPHFFGPIRALTKKLNIAFKIKVI